MAVEFALILPLVVTLLLGVMTAGIALSHGLGLTNAVREGARFAAITPYPPASGNWANDVRAWTRATQFDDPSVASKICVNLYKQGATGELIPSGDRCSTSTITETPGNFAAPSGTPPDTCVVQVWAARTYSINVLLFRWDRVMSRRSVAVYERTC